MCPYSIPRGYRLKPSYFCSQGISRCTERQPRLPFGGHKKHRAADYYREDYHSFTCQTGKALGEEIGLCVNPEFLTEIASTWTDDEQYNRGFLTEDRIVIVEYDRKSGDTLEQLYKPVGKPIFGTDLKTAEMIKYACNCMLATKISFWNEVFLICQKLGVDSQQVASIAALDPRIGKYGTVHGEAFGGKCLPKHLEAFISFAKDYHNPALSAAVKEINNCMVEYYRVRE